MRDISYTTRRKLVDRTATVPRNPPASWTDGITPKLSSRWRHWVRGSKTPRSRRRTRPKKTKEKRSRRRGNTGKVRDHETWKWEGFRKCERQRKRNPLPQGCENPSFTSSEGFKMVHKEVEEMQNKASVMKRELEKLNHELNSMKVDVRKIQATDITLSREIGLGEGKHLCKFWLKLYLFHIVLLTNIYTMTDIVGSFHWPRYYEENIKIEF